MFLGPRLNSSRLRADAESMEAGPAKSLLLALAEAAEHQLDPGQLADLQELLGRGLVKPADPPRMESLDRAFEDLQGRHRLLLEAKSAAQRLAGRMAPRSGLGRWLPGGAPKPPEADDQDLAGLHRLLQALELDLRGVAGPPDLVHRLAHVQDHLQVEDRDCLDRMGDIDRELASLRQQGPGRIKVNPFGWVTLTAAGERELPEWAALQDLEAAFNLVSGPRRQKIDDYSLFRHDPANLLAFLLENPLQRAHLAEAVAAFEDLAEPFGRQATALGIRSTRIRNAFLIRLVRLHREDPKGPFAWVGRERLKQLSEQACRFLPASMAGQGWPLVYGVDVLVAGRTGAPAEARLRLLEGTLAQLSGAFPGHPARDGQGIRLAFAMLHALLDRTLASPVLEDRFLSVLVHALQAGRQAAPLDLPDEGSRLVFGYHLAHLAEFIPARIPGLSERLQRLERALGDRGRHRSTPLQVLLHGLLVLERLERGGRAVSPEEYAGTYLRVRNWIRGHKDLARAFHTEHNRAEDEAFLAANVTARAFLTRPAPPGPGRSLPDVGVASAYEEPDHCGAPMLGQPFGTLMLQ